MQIRHLEYILELERAGSINRAAANLYISQQGLSKIIDAMETELGAKLVERSRKGARLTAAGRRFCGHARTIVAEYAEATDALAEDAAARAAPLEVAVSAYVVMVLMGRAMTGLDSRIEANYTEVANSRIADALAAGEEDRLFLFDWIGNDPLGGRRRTGPALEVGSFLTARMGVVMGAADAPDSITREEVLTRSVVAYGRSDYRRMLNLVLGGKSNPHIVAALSDIAYTADALKATPGACAVVDELSLPREEIERSGLAFVPLTPQVRLTVGYAFVRDGERAPLHRSFSRAWKEAVG